MKLSVRRDQLPRLIGLPSGVGVAEVAVVNERLDLTLDGLDGTVTYEIDAHGRMTAVPTQEPVAETEAAPADAGLADVGLAEASPPPPEQPAVTTRRRGGGS
jgi:hypothetical protein